MIILDDFSGLTVFSAITVGYCTSVQDKNIIERKKGMSVGGPWNSDKSARFIQIKDLQLSLLMVASDTSKATRQWVTLLEG